MALIMADVEEAAQRLDELVDAAVGGAEVIVGREGRPLVVMIRLEDPRPRGSTASRPAGRGRCAEAPEEPGTDGAPNREVVIKHVVGIEVYLA